MFLKFWNTLGLIRNIAFLTPKCVKKGLCRSKIPFVIWKNLIVIQELYLWFLHFYLRFEKPIKISKQGKYYFLFEFIPLEIHVFYL